MEETTLSSQHGTLLQARLVKLCNHPGWKAVLLLGLAIACSVVFFFVFLPRITTPSQHAIPAEQAVRRESRIDPQEQAYWDGIARKLIAEGTLTPDHPVSPEAQQAKSATPMTSKERIKHYEDVVTNILN